MQKFETQPLAVGGKAAARASAEGATQFTKRPPAATATTALMKQYLAIKETHADDVLLFRLGDFYEMFYEDAEITARVLGIVLTSRNNGPDAYAMSGFPYHALDRYLPRLIAAGHSVAICEQTQDPAEVKGRGIVERQVIEVITPGTLTDEKHLDASARNFLCVVHLPRAQTKPCGVAWFEVSSGRFLVAEVERERLEGELERIDPAEIAVGESVLRAAEDDPAGETARLIARLRRRCPLATVPDHTLRPKRALEQLKQHYGVGTLSGMGLDDKAAYVAAAHATLHYVGEKKPGMLPKLQGLGRGIELFRPDDHLSLDPATARCLELTRPLRDGGGRSATLLGAIDRTRTAMGGRLLREWLQAPLRDLARIVARQDAVGALVAGPKQLEALGIALREVYDLERLAARVASGRAQPRDLACLRDSLGKLPAIRGAARAAAEGSPSALLEAIAGRLDPLQDLQERLAQALVESPAQAPKDGPIVAPGFHAELDRLRRDATNVTETLAEFQREEQERTGIGSLKIGFNKVYGYYIEVSQANRNKVPERYIRKQTLKHCERFLTPELKELEARVLTAKESAEQLEAALFQELREQVAAQTPALLTSAAAAAELDVLGSLARLARERGYVRPSLTEHTTLEIVGGRHPVLDVAGERFVPNDLRIGGDEGTVHLITGPNMAGKSTYIRQSALLVLLAQTGAFIPADEAQIGLVDRIFARVGAGDELAQGMSTFMVEMTETANILRHATDRSLVILDEVGRGTSTYDGVSLAWAIAEYLHDKLKARTLFATHYHELTGMPALREGVRNKNVAVDERGDDVVFLHRIVPGSAGRSYGIHVARLAGVPARVLTRAQVILRQLENGTFDASAAIQEADDPPESEAPQQQLGLFALKEDKVRARLRALDVTRTTPLEALLLLDELKRLIAE